MKSNNQIIVLSLIAISLSLLSILFTGKVARNSTGNQNGLTWRVLQSGNNEVDVYLSGNSASQVLGTDLNVFFDNKNLLIDSVEPGGFFPSPIVIRMNSDALTYSLLANPQDKAPNDLTKPLLKFHLSGNKIQGVKFYVLPSSQVYISNVGGAFPQSDDLVLN